MDVWILSMRSKTKQAFFQRLASNFWFFAAFSWKLPGGSFCADWTRLKTVGNWTDGCRRKERRMWHRLGAEPTLLSFCRKTSSKKRKTSKKIIRLCLFENLKYWLVRTRRHFASDIFNLSWSLSRAAAGMIITLKFPSACCSQNPSNFFHSYSVFFTVFDDVSAAIKSSSSRLELSLSCSSFSICRLSSSKSLRNQLESLGRLPLSFVLSLRLRNFSLYRVKIFF